MYHEDDIRELVEIVTALKETIDTLVSERKNIEPTADGVYELNLMIEAHGHVIRLSEYMDELQKTFYS